RGRDGRGAGRREAFRRIDGAAAHPPRHRAQCHIRRAQTTAPAARRKAAGGRQMMASWMLYCLLCALGLALSALLVERAMLAGRSPVRHVWIGAVVLSFVLPALAFRFASRPVVIDETPVSASSEAALDSILAAWQAAPHVSNVTPRSAAKPETSSSWHAFFAR